MPGARIVAPVLPTSIVDPAASPFASHPPDAPASVPKIVEVAPPDAPTAVSVVAEVDASPPQTAEPTAGTATHASAPIGALSRAALQGTLAEFTASAREARAVTGAAWRWLRVGAEKQLGIEVSIEDPAMRELFGHLLQVEELLVQVRAQGLALSHCAQLSADGSQAKGSKVGPSGVNRGSSAASVVLAQGLERLARPVDAGGLRGREPLVTSPQVDRQAACVGLADTVSDAVWQTISLSPNASESGSARYCMERRLRDEVFDPIEKQLLEHERVRDLLRERQMTQQSHKDCLKDSVQRRSGDGLRPLIGRARTETGLQDRLKVSQARVAELDEEVFSNLLEMRRRGRATVSKPWSALARTRADFYRSLAGNWAPVATALGAGSMHVETAARGPESRTGLRRDLACLADANDQESAAATFSDRPSGDVTLESFLGGSHELEHDGTLSPLPLTPPAEPLGLKIDAQEKVGDRSSVEANGFPISGSCAFIDSSAGVWPTFGADAVCSDALPYADGASQADRTSDTDVIKPVICSGLADQAADVTALPSTKFDAFGVAHPESSPVDPAALELSGGQ